VRDFNGGTALAFDDHIEDFDAPTDIVAGDSEGRHGVSVNVVPFTGAWRDSLERPEDRGGRLEIVSWGDGERALVSPAINLPLLRIDAIAVAGQSVALIGAGERLWGFDWTTLAMAPIWDREITGRNAIIGISPNGHLALVGNRDRDPYSYSFDAVGVTDRSR